MNESITSTNPLTKVAQPIANDALLPVEQSSELVISRSSLSFIQTSPSKPCFQVLTIAQQQPSTSVTITSDNPECFQVAADSRPAFLPTLTMTPAAQGTYVHVRYLATKGRLDMGQLIIQHDRGTETVDLAGRKKRSFSAVRHRLPYSGQRGRVSHARKPQTGKRLMILLLSLSVLISLVYLVFINRINFSSADPTTSQIETKSNPLPLAKPAEAVRKIPDKKTAAFVPATQAKTKPTRRKEDELTQSSSPKRRPENSKPLFLNQAREQEVAVQEPSYPKREKIPVPNQAVKKQKPQTKTAPLNTVSELEQVLNQP